MILAMFGKPRSGKSYETVAFQIIPTLRSGRKVITNIPLNIEKFNLIFGHEFIAEHLEIRHESVGLVTKKIDGVKRKVKGHAFESIECYADDWRNEDGVGALLVIDECHYVLPRGKTPLEISQWYSKHGHAGFDILLLTQNFRKVDLDIRDMCEVVYYVHKMTTFGKPKEYIRKVKNGFSGDYDKDNETIRSYDATFFPFYKSHSMSAMAIKEEGAKDIKGHKSILKKKGLLVCIFIMLTCLSFIFYRVSFADEQPAPKAVDNKLQLKLNKPVQLTKVDEPIEPLTKPIVLGVTPSITQGFNTGSVQKSKTHPFYRVDLHIKWHIDFEGSTDYMFDASTNGFTEFVLLSRDLIKAGYVITPITDCLVKISYEDTYNDFLICDSSDISSSFAQN